MCKAFSGFIEALDSKGILCTLKKVLLKKYIYSFGFIEVFDSEQNNVSERERITSFVRK